MSDRQGKEAELYLAAIVRNSDDAIVSKDLNGTITSWNPAAEEIFGYSAAEAVGRSIRIIIPPDRQSEEDDVLARLSRGESIDHFETVRMRKDGTQFPVSITVSPIRNGDGIIIGASKIARDISFRRTAEARVREAEDRRVEVHQRLTALVAASGSLLGSPRIEEVLPAIISLAGGILEADAYAVWRFDEVGTAWKMAASEGLSETFVHDIITSFRGREAAPAPLLDPIVAADVNTVVMLEERRQAYHREGITSMLVIPLASGSDATTATLVFYYRSARRFAAEEIESARALGFIAGAALRTADLYSEQRSRQRQALFLAQAATALASSLDYRNTLSTLAQLAVPQIADWCAVHILSAAGTFERLAVAHPDPERVRFANEFYERYPPRPEDPGGLGEVVRTGRPIIVEQLTDEMIVAGARSVQHLADIRELGVNSFMMVPLRTRKGTIGAITFVAAAESGRRYTEADLRFAETVADRASLAVENSWAYDEAKSANQLKDDFLATLSHELRTPLNAMLGYTRMLRASAVPQDRRDAALEVIERNGKMLAQIVDEVLDVSRIVSGKLRLSVQRLDPASLLTDAIAIVAPAADAKGIQLRSNIDPGVQAVQADPDRLQQVLWNVLTNAVKFTPSGGTIDVSIAALDAEVEIVVSDTGRGIDPAFLPYIFERFRQADSRFTREYGGLGLGLSIARNIVEMHGGTIHAESEGQGHGSTFRIRLPAFAVAAGASQV
jgi:PAS domain S-box-containing protein